RFPSPLFLFALGCLDARSSGNYAERCHIKCEMKALWMDSGAREMAALGAGCAWLWSCGGAGRPVVSRYLWRGLRIVNYRSVTTFAVDHRVRGVSVAILALPDLCFVILSGRLGHLDP